MGLVTLEKEKPQLIQETQVKKAPGLGRSSMYLEMRSASFKLSPPAAHVSPFNPELFRFLITVGCCSILHSYVYCIVTLGHRKPLVSDTSSSMGLTLHVLEEGDR